MGRSSTVMPVYTNINPRKHYNDLS